MFFVNHDLVKHCDAHSQHVPHNNAYVLQLNCRRLRESQVELASGCLQHVEQCELDYVQQDPPPYDD